MRVWIENGVVGVGLRTSRCGVVVAAAAAAVQVQLGSLKCSDRSSGESKRGRRWERI